jgi:Bacterial Ig domain
MTSPAVLCVDRVVPTVAVTSPAAGNVANVITIAANAADNDQIASVRFQIDGSVLGTVASAPFQMNWDTHGAVNGAHTIYAVATDRVGNQTVASVGINITNVPVINFYNPGNGATVTDTVGLYSYVTQYGTGVSVYFYVDGNNIYGQGGGSGYYQVGYDTHNLGVGWHTITCIAVDYQGNQARLDYGMYVNNQPPGPGIVSLGNHAEWNGDYYDDYRHSAPNPYGEGGDWIWTATGAKFNPVYLPGNPNPTYYQMRVWWHGDRVEGGSDGNVCNMDFQVGGIVGWTTVWSNGPLYGNVGPLWNVNGGEPCYAKWWATYAGNNTNFCQGIGFYYDFVPRYAS